MEYLSEKNWIEKSKALIYAEWSKFDIHELQIFETYLSRINPRDPESSCVRFTRNEYAKMMGYADGRNLKTKVLDKWVKNFMAKQITINYGNGDKRHVNLFSDATVHKDKDTGEIVIDLDCNFKLKQVFFDIAKSGYISYQRRNTINFKSEYTLKLYCMLKDHAWGNYEWIVELKELKNMLGATEQLYEKFPELNRRILKKAEEEINGHTDIGFTYERITKGRLTRAIKFKIEDVDEKNLPGQMNIYDYPEALPENPKAPELTPEEKFMQTIPDGASSVTIAALKFYAGACDYEFTYEEMDLLSMAAGEVVEDDFLSIESRQQDIYKFISFKYRAMCRKRKLGKVNTSSFGWLLKSIKEDY